MIKMKFIYANSFHNYYDDPTVQGGQGEPPPKPDPPKTFTQEDVNRMLADDRRKHKVQLDKHIQQLEELKQKSGLSEQEKTDLQSRIEELQNQNLTKEELAKKERDKLTTEYEKEKKNLLDERDRWKNQYHTSTILRNIMDEAVKAEAFSPEQIVAILQQNTRLVEDLDQDGKPTGTYTPKVKFSDSDKEGKPITLELTISEAMKRMKEVPERFGNLFKSGANSGLGSQAQRDAAARRGPNDVANMSPAEYQEWRKKNKFTRR